MSALTVSEKRTLQACEEDIERGAGLMSKALKKIYDEQLFRESDESFADYCQRRWNIKKSRAYQLVGHAGIVAGLIEAGEDSTIVEKITEAATREIADLPTETQAEVVREAAKESGGKAPTAKQTAAAREKVSPKPASPKQQIDDFFESKESTREKAEEKQPKPKVMRADADMPESYVDDNGDEVPRSLWGVWRQKTALYQIRNDLQVVHGKLAKYNESEASCSFSVAAEDLVHDAIGKAGDAIPSVVDDDSWLAAGECEDG